LLHQADGQAAERVDVIAVVRKDSAVQLACLAISPERGGSRSESSLAPGPRLMPVKLWTTRRQPRSGVTDLGLSRRSGTNSLE
jgi:hypothetical protein